MSCRLFFRWLLAAVVAILWTVSPKIRAQGEGLTYDPVVRIVSAEYVPPEKAKGKQLIRFKFDILKGVPTGTKIQLKLTYTGLGVDEKWLEVGTERKGVTFDWVPDEKLGPDDRYQLFRSIPLDDQTHRQSPEVLQALRSADGLPWDARPWSYSPPEDETVTIGTAEEIADLPNQICKLYDGFIAGFVKNKKDFEKAAEAIKAGSRYVEGGSLDQEAFARFIKDWRVQQGKTQQRIMELPITNMTVHQRSLSAHFTLINLARMVSRWAYDVEKEIVKQYRATPVQVTNDEKDKSDDALRWYERWNRPVKSDTLTEYAGVIYAEVCPEPEEETPAPAGDGAKEGSEKETEEAPESGKKKEGEKKPETRRAGGARPGSR